VPPSYRRTTTVSSPVMARCSQGICQPQASFFGFHLAYGIYQLKKYQ